MDVKKLFKVLIGVAWVDGVIQPEERQFLHRKAQDYQVADDPEIKGLLLENKPVPPAECYRWVEEYLGENHSSEDYVSLLETMSALIYSDGEVEVEEAKLLTMVQALDPDQDSNQSIIDNLLQAIRKLYQKGVQQGV